VASAIYCTTRVVGALGRDRVGARPICSQCRSAATEGVRPLARSLMGRATAGWRRLQLLTRGSAPGLGACAGSAPCHTPSAPAGMGRGGAGGGWMGDSNPYGAGGSSCRGGGGQSGGPCTHALLYGSSTTPLYPPTAHPAAAACRRRLPPPAPTCTTSISDWVGSATVMSSSSESLAAYSPRSRFSSSPGCGGRAGGG
jgi:hypothetical protein